MSVFTGKSALALALAATALTAASPAMARDRYYRGHRGDDAAVAIGAGLVGLAVGAAIASDRDDRYERVYYNDGYYYPRRHYVETYYYGDYPRYQPHYYYRGGPVWRGPVRYHRDWDRHGWRHRW